MQERFTHEVWISLAIIGVAVAIFSVLIFIFSGQLTSAADDIIADRTTINKRVEAGEVLARLKSDEGKAGSYEKAMNTLLPPQDQLLSFPEWIDGIARVSGVSLSFSFQGNQMPSTAEAPGFINFSGALGGSMNSLINFTEGLELKSQKYLISFDSLDVSQADNGYRGNISGKIYTQ